MIKISTGLYHIVIITLLYYCFRTLGSPQFINGALIAGVMIAKGLLSEHFIANKWT